MIESKPRKRSAQPVSEPESPASHSQGLVKWCFLIGVMTLVVAPVVTIKMAEWKIRQDDTQKVEEPAAVASDIKTDNLHFGGPFSLINQDGAPVTEATFRGKNLLVLFGYTYCPDLCPTALQNITETLDELGPAADNVQVLFITVDPARDTPAKLKDYVTSFNPKIVGLTGSAEQIAAVAKEFQVTYSKAEDTDKGEYVMDYSTLMYVMSPEGKPLASMDMEQVDPGSIAGTLRRLWKLPEPVPSK